MGKSTVASLLAARGERLIDADELARELVKPGQPALREIKAAFGDAVLQADGTLDRARLGQLVFANAERRSVLESILHPRIREAWKTGAQRWAEQGAKRGIVVIPLLFETGAEKELNLTICVACTRRTQENRLRNRGWKEEEISNRISSQKPIGEKMDRADRVVWNESTMEVCELQVARIFSGLQ